jgi:putative salt-induced outer membrane protein YdiY
MTATRRPLWLLVVLLVAAQSISVSAKRKDDHLIMANGDQLVGEVKKLEHGQLYFKADYMLNSMQVDWTQVRELRSQDEYQVLLSNGQQPTGTIERAADGTFTISRSGSTMVATVSTEVIGMLPVETDFWAQLTGNIDSGFSYTSGNSQTQFTASGMVAYITSRYVFNLSGSSTFSGQSDGTNTNRNNISLTNQFTIKPKLYTVVLGELLHSDQQDLDLRTTLGGGLGRQLVQTGRTSLNVFGGVVYTNERYSAPPDPNEPGSQNANNIEGVLGLQFAMFRFKTTDISSTLSVYPSFTTPGRVRLNFTPTLNLEIARNLYWNFTLYENYDSQPPVNANKNDFGVTNSIGWKF